MRRTGLLLFVLFAAATARAEEPSPLTAADVRYLKTLGQSQAELTAQRPTPAMLDRLHQLINDPVTVKKPKARSDAVYRYLDHINAQYIWCTDNPKDKDCDGFKPASAP